MVTGIELPLELAVLLCAGCIAAGVWAGRMRANRRLNPRRNFGGDPLGPLHQPEVLAKAIDLAARRNAVRANSKAALHRRIDQFANRSEIWNSQTRREVREHVAAVMRAGLRRDDRRSLGDGDSFTIYVPGTTERAAVRIAERLRRKLSQLHLPHLGSQKPLTASFGVAAKRYGDMEAGLGQRARAAFGAAMANGRDYVVPASDIEEIMLLPAPSPSASAA